MPSARTSTVSVKSSRERVAAIRVSSQGTTRLPPTRMSAVSSATLTAASARLAATLESPRPRAEDRRHHHEHEDGQQVFDDEPADGDVSRRACAGRDCRRGRG